MQRGCGFKISGGAGETRSSIWARLSLKCFRHPWDDVKQKVRHKSLAFRGEEGLGSVVFLCAEWDISMELDKQSL